MTIATVEAVPPLCAGDFLSAKEFMRRWENEPRLKRAELIKGVVYMPSPVSIQHGETEAMIATWLGVYQAATLGTGVASNATTIIDDDVPQPDVHLRILPECGGQTWVEGNYLCGGPELLVEICLTSAAYDLHQKRDIYRDARVQEYVAVVFHSHEIRWHRLIDGEYQIIPPDADQIYRSQTFPGLWLNGAALLSQQPGQVLATLHEGLATREHREFVERLARAKAAS
ncbi:MAG: Uma2 family endonuclease [Planctomycetota bacterium]